MARALRGDRILKRLEAAGAMTPAGVSWVKCCLDPFHDNPISGIAGWPDTVTAPSITRCIKKSITITKPDTLPVGNWGFSCHMLPWLNRIPMTVNTRKNNTINAVSLPSAHGGVEVICCDTSYEIDFADNPSFFLYPDNDYLDGLSRLIGIGYEIKDDTAPLYQQGHSYHCRQSNNIGSQFGIQVRQATVSTPICTATAQPYRPIMPNAASMMLLPDTVEWPSREGCYVVGSFNDINSPSMVTYTTPFVPTYTGNGLGDDQIGIVNNSDVMAAEPTVDGDVSTMAYMPAVKLAPIDLSQSLFTGLLDQATFTLTVHFYIETFPSIAETPIIVLASPSAMYDPVALEFYSRAVQSLPVAVPVGDNPDGEWWSEVVGDGMAALSGIASLAGMPELAPFIMGGGALLQQGLKSWSRPKQLAPVPQPPPRDRNHRKIANETRRMNQPNNRPRPAQNRANAIARGTAAKPARKRRRRKVRTNRAGN